MTIFGRVHYSSIEGPFMVITCHSEADYQKALEEACRWSESEPEAVGIRGELCSASLASSFDGERDAEQCAGGVW